MVATTNAERQAEPQAGEKKVEKVDFKMVSFVLAGKEYGIDIMNVKEIAYASAFTYVPNSAPFVRGVYNLRGEIISIIDLRIMFHLPSERKAEGALESMLILGIGDRTFGIIVDSIDKVIGVASQNIQPPHPIFGDINVKYIRGIIENAKKLYIILDVEKIFARDKEGSDRDKAQYARESAAERPSAGAATIGAAKAYDADEDDAGPRSESGDIEAKFIKENLFQFRGFAVTPINDKWYDARFREWTALKKGVDVQLHSIAEADAFLEGFYSPGTGRLWPEEYAAAIEAALPAVDGKTINVWNPGCGKGYESYSLACVLLKRYPGVRIKIWANDSDLLNVSMAPNMVFPQDEAPERYRPFMVEGKNGLSFNQEVRDAVFFEYHDVLNPSPLPALDFIVSRDMLSFLAPIDQKRVLVDFGEKLKKTGSVLVGENEALPRGEGWVQAPESAFYVREEE